MAVVTLALGIGACVAIFSAVDGVLLRPLPYPQSGRLVAIHETLLPRLPEFAVSPRHYFAWRAQATGFEDMGAWHEGSHNLTGLGEPIRVSAGRVTASLFTTLGVPPALGRVFSPAEDHSGGQRVVVLGHGFWQRQLGGRPDVLQRTVTLDGQPFTIVGVMPPASSSTVRWTCSLRRPIRRATCMTSPSSGGCARASPSSRRAARWR